MTLLVINTAIVTAGVIVFLIVTLILVGMLLVCQSKTNSQGGSEGQHQPWRKRDNNGTRVNLIGHPRK